MSNEALAARDAVETVVGLGGVIELANHPFPAPSAGAIALLDAIESPFVAEEAAEEIGMLDLLRALYVLENREKAVLPVLRIKRRRRELALLSEKEPSGPVSLMLAEEAKLVGDAEAELDAAALRFGDTLGGFDFAGVVAELGGYLSLATGFAMLPRDENEDEKKTPAGALNG